jgi:homoserine kinase
MTQAVGRVVCVSGSTSNLGPGFDALGLALRIYLRVRF